MTFEHGITGSAPLLMHSLGLSDKNDELTGR